MGEGSWPWSGCAGRPGAAVGLIGGCLRWCRLRLLAGGGRRILVRRPFRCTGCRQRRLVVTASHTLGWDDKPPAVAADGRPSLLLVELEGSRHGQRQRRWLRTFRYQVAAARARAGGREQRRRPPPRPQLVGTWLDAAMASLVAWRVANEVGKKMMRLLAGKITARHV